MEIPKTQFSFDTHLNSHISHTRREACGTLWGKPKASVCIWEGHSEITHLVFSFLSRLFGVQITSLRVLLGAVASENQMSITTDS